LVALGDTERKIVLSGLETGTVDWPVRAQRPLSGLSFWVWDLGVKITPLEVWALTVTTVHHGSAVFEVKGWPDAILTALIAPIQGRK
jgi:hypothetical protein